MDKLKIMNFKLLLSIVFQSVLFALILFFVSFLGLNLFTDIINNLVALFIIMFIISLLISISSTLEHDRSRGITRFFVLLSQFLIWFSMMYLILSAIIYLTLMFIAIPVDYLLAIYIFIIPIIAIYGYIKAHTIKINEHELFIENLEEEISILHFSDVHIGSVNRGKLLRNIASKINSVEADLAILSGDLADGSCPIAIDDFSYLKESNIPIIFTPGNHDYYPGIENVIKAAEFAGLKVLLNDKISFKSLSIHGFFMASVLKPGVSIKNSEDFSRINPDELNIVINHFPTNWEEFKNMGVDIQLSGHTHGGQFYPIKFLIRGMFKYVRGVFKDNNKYLVVSDGVGTFQSPIRWGTNSEILLLKLKKISN
ncbi:putative metallophosphoesterase [Methanobrevibacter curvatus]|uniref:Putative metallophosphoesterase n=2 Tax=Methanobrevibacter curvatus TaxID=49547 RepID=A0A166CNH9_9EURY|nr:putative metallophosphoesterase [Methanobrevibacter curvatus]